jgi:hypothetical protein
MSDADEYPYPPEWLPQSRRPQPPEPPSTEQPIESLRSGCPDPLAGERTQHDDYPPDWRRPRR